MRATEARTPEALDAALASALDSITPADARGWSNHMFGSPENATSLIQRAKKAAKPVVLSPIYLDLSEHDIYSRRILEIFKHGADERILLPAYASIRAQLKARRAEAFPSYEIMPDYYRRVRALIAQADHVILLSEDERAKLRRIGAEPTADKSSIVHNPGRRLQFPQCITGFVRTDLRAERLRPGSWPP